MENRDSAVGALLGLAAGDAVGTTLEFQQPGTFEPITDLVGGGPFRLQAGQWTDDTSMALCLAESLLDRGGMDLGDQLRRYLLWKDRGYFSSTGSCFDIGATTRQQLERFRRTGEPVDPRVDEESAANGSLMRLAAVPVRWWRDPALAAEMSGESSRSTHPARRPVDACRLYGAMLVALIGGASFDDVVGPGFWSWGDLHPEIAAIAAGSWRGKEPPAIRGSGYCVAALEAAIWAVAGAADFRDAVLRAANLGDDADTTAAIAGQLAGARWGAAGIPPAWQAKLTGAERIVSIAEGLFAAGGAALPPWRAEATHHAWWVEPGLLAGEYPAAKDDPVASRAKVELMLDAGIRTFVDLTEPGELTPYAPALLQAAEERALEVRRLSFPIPDQGIVDDASYDPILAAITEGLGRGGVYVHCWGGIGRTGTVIGCRLADSGLTAAEVETRLAELRSATKKARRRAPETDGQSAVIARRAGRG